jgi:predicted negative regulator of RcsB-dependent stress response
VDRLTRKELKKDKFALEVGHTVEFFEHHRRKITIYGAAVVGLILVVAVVVYYSRTQQAARQSALRAALDIVAAPVGPGIVPGVLSYSAQSDKDTAVNRAWSEMISKYSGSEEAAIAEYYLGTAAVGQGRLEEAVTRLGKVASSGKKEPASLASLALAQVYSSQGKTADAEKLLRALIASPTVMVPKAEATMALARLLAPGKPDEAKKLLEPLRSAPGATGRAAIAAYGDLFAQR